MKKNIFLLLLFFVFFSAAGQNGSIENITCKQAMELILHHKGDTNFIILDVRTPEEFKSGYIENSILVDFKADDFKDKISRLDRDRTYLVYCRRGGRSAETITLMKDLKFKNLYHLFEGMDGWKEEGYKTVVNK